MSTSIWKCHAFIGFHFAVAWSAMITAPAWAAPIPKPKNELLLWTYNFKTSELTYYGVDGTLRKSQKLFDGDSFMFISLTKDGNKIIYKAANRDKPNNKTRDLTYQIRPIDAEFGKNLNVPIMKDEYYFNLSSDFKQVIGLNINVLVKKSECHHAIWDVEKQKLIRLELPTNIRLQGITPDGKYYHGMRSLSKTESEYVTVSMDTLEIKPVFPKEKRRMIRVAFMPDMKSIFGDVEESTDEKGRIEYVVRNYPLPSGAPTTFIRKSEAFEVFLYPSPDGKYIARYMINYKEVRKSIEPDHKEIEISNSIGTNVRSVVRLNHSENCILGWIAPGEK